MDIGKIKLQVPQTYSGDPESSLSDLYSALVILSTELAVTPGFAVLPCSVAVTRGMAANINSGRLRPADASLSRPAIGIVVNSASAGQKARIILGMGYASGLSGLTVNASVYLGNAGALVFVKPGSGMIQGLGFVLTTSEMFVTISQP